MALQYLQGYPNPNTLNRLPEARAAGSKKVQIIGNLQATAANLVVTDRIYVGKIPTSAIILPTSLLTHDGIAGLTSLHFGFDEPGAAATLASALNLATGGTKNLTAAVATSNLMRQVWQHLGLTRDPGRFVDLIATVNAAPTASGWMFFDVDYVDGR